MVDISLQIGAGAKASTASELSWDLFCAVSDCFDKVGFFVRGVVACKLAHR